MLQDRCPPETPQNKKIMTLERAKGKGMGWKEEREKGRKKRKEHNDRQRRKDNQTREKIRSIQCTAT